LYEETVCIRNNISIRNQSQNQTRATKVYLFNKSDILARFTFFFNPPKGEEAHRILSCRAHMRKTWMFGRQLGSGAEAFQGASPPLGKQHSTVSSQTIFQSTVEAQTMKPQF